ncbi:hypothetical protein MMC31_001116 [Peltigera leucophlebia]|nr:hypothetical protein [Peltigera leucophlebia]
MENPQNLMTRGSKHARKSTEKKKLLRAPLSAETIATAENPFWRSSLPILNNTSEAHGGQQNSSPATGNIAKPDDETIEARTETVPDVNQSLSKRPIPLDWRSSESDRSSSSVGHHYQLSSGTVRELLEASYRKGEAWKGIPLGENTYLSKLPFPSAKSRGTNDEVVKAPQRTAPGEQNPSSTPPLPSSSVDQRPPGRPKNLSCQALAPPPARLLGVRLAEEHAEEDSRSFRYFSNLDVSLKRHVAGIQNQTAKLPPRKRKHVATEDDNDDGLAAQSQHRELPNPSPDSKIQKIPTKEPSNQYYSHQAIGGWRMLNAKDAAIEIEKEKEAKTVVEKRRSESTPAGTDYPHLLSCRPSDKLWKSWENKHLLRSHVASKSFAQIGSSAQFNKGLVIRTEDECREQYETLQQWQPFQDEELRHAGKSAENDSFAAVCARNFSQGLVKRSAQQCWERYEFLKKSEFEAFE